MMVRCIAWSARHPWFVLAAAACLAVAGAWARREVRRAYIPELSDPQIAVVAEWMGHSAPEVEESVTRVVADALRGLSGSTGIRGQSMSGMSYVAVFFDPDAHLDDERRAAIERVAGVRSKLPDAIRIQVGPAATSAGWVFEYALVTPVANAALQRLRVSQDSILSPALAAIPGVAEVATVGGSGQEVVIEALPEELRRRGLAFGDLVSTARARLRRHPSPSLEELVEAPISLPRTLGPTARVRDVARARIASEMPTGFADLAGQPAIGGIVIARRDADLSAIVEAARRILDRELSRLPPGTQITMTYDRLELADRVERTLLRALGEEVAVVALVIFVFLWHGPSALVPVVTLPFVLLSAFAAMWALGAPATIMSLGGMGIALGLAVDADVVALEACHRRLESVSQDGDRGAALLLGAGSVVPAIVASLLLTALAFLPVFAIGGETGRLFRPLAIGKTLVIASAALTSLTLAPVLRQRLLTGRITPEVDNVLARYFVRVYRPFVSIALRWPALTLATAGLALVSSIPIVLRLGGEFLPSVDEGDLLFMPTTLPGAPPHEAAEQLAKQDSAIAKLPEVATVFGKVGRAETATDPAPFSMAETTIRLRPPSEWPPVYRRRWYSSWAPGELKAVLRLAWPDEVRATSEELIEKLDAATRMPGWTNVWTAPARARLDMMATGTRTPLAVRVTGSDPERLEILGGAVRNVLQRLPGTRNALLESLGREVWLDFVPDPAAVRRFGVDPVQLASTLDVALRGGGIGSIEQGERRLGVRLLLGGEGRSLENQVGDATVRGGTEGVDQPVPLGLLGSPTYVSKPSMLRTEARGPVTYVYVDLERGVDLDGYVARAQRELDAAVARREVRLAPGERLEWAGEVPLLAAGRRSVGWIALAVGVAACALLALFFGSMTEALIVLLAVPFGLVGSVWSLFFLGYPISAPVWVGLLSMTGLAMQTGVVMVVYIDDAFFRRLRAGELRDRDDVVEAHAEGTVERLRPKLMTVITMAGSLLPLLWAEGVGAETLRRIAAPMLGGLVSSAFLTLEVLPVLYTIWRCRQLERARRLGVPIERIVGDGPRWMHRRKVGARG
jgi:Cu(I)/Ag(I) efflux system membrane protein CusA/SilA